MKYASASCRGKAYYRRRRGRPEDQALGPQHCRACGNAFMPTKKTQRYCEGDCRIVSAERLYEEREARRKLRSMTKMASAIAASTADPENFAYEVRVLQSELDKLTL